MATITLVLHSVERLHHAHIMANPALIARTAAQVECRPGAREPDLIILAVGRNYIRWYDPIRDVQGIDVWVGNGPVTIPDPLELHS
jgi:hypothetical protein